MVTKEGQAESRETSISAYYFDSRISVLTEPLFKELVENIREPKAVIWLSQRLQVPVWISVCM